MFEILLHELNNNGFEVANYLYSLIDNNINNIN
jgi:hypothetical protein